MEARPHPEQGFPTCLSDLSLAKCLEANRIHAACRQGVTIEVRSASSIKSILNNELDQAIMEPEAEELPLQNPNIHGQNYYQ